MLLMMWYGCCAVDDKGKATTLIWRHRDLISSSKKAMIKREQSGSRGDVEDDNDRGNLWVCARAKHEGKVERPDVAC